VDSAVEKMWIMQRGKFMNQARDCSGRRYTRHLLLQVTFFQSLEASIWKISKNDVRFANKRRSTEARADLLKVLRSYKQNTEILASPE
jgi:hypothetical protein